MLLPLRKRIPKPAQTAVPKRPRCDAGRHFTHIWLARLYMVSGSGARFRLEFGPGLLPESKASFRKCWYGQESLCCCCHASQPLSPPFQVL